MNKFRYSITSHPAPAFGEPGRRIYDVIATDVETGLRYPLGCVSDKDKAKAIRDEHKAKVVAVDDSQPTLRAGQTVYLIENGQVVERKVDSIQTGNGTVIDAPVPWDDARDRHVKIKYGSHYARYRFYGPSELFPTLRSASIALARRLRSQAATLIEQAEELESVQ